MAQRRVRVQLVDDIPDHGVQVRVVLAFEAQLAGLVAEVPEAPEVGDPQLAPERLEHAGGHGLGALRRRVVAHAPREHRPRAEHVRQLHRRRRAVAGELDEVLLVADLQPPADQQVAVGVVLLQGLGDDPVQGRAHLRGELAVAREQPMLARLPREELVRSAEVPLLPAGAEELRRRPAGHQVARVEQVHAPRPVLLAQPLRRGGVLVVPEAQPVVDALVPAVVVDEVVLEVVDGRAERAVQVGGRRGDARREQLLVVLVHPRQLRVWIQLGELQSPLARMRPGHQQRPGAVEGRFERLVLLDVEGLEAARGPDRDPKVLVPRALQRDGALELEVAHRPRLVGQEVLRRAEHPVEVVVEALAADLDDQSALGIRLDPERRSPLPGSRAAADHQRRDARGDPRPVRREPDLHAAREVLHRQVVAVPEPARGAVPADEARAQLRREVLHRVLAVAVDIGRDRRVAVLLANRHDRAVVGRVAEPEVVGAVVARLVGGYGHGECSEQDREGRAGGDGVAHGV